jgi:cell wall-associated NlpC family hydrolase
VASHATHSHPDAKLKFIPTFVLSVTLRVKILCRIRAIVRDSFNGIVGKVFIRVIKFTLVALQLWACSVAWAEQDASDKRRANKASSSQENYHSAHHQHQKTKRSPPKNDGEEDPSQTPSPKGRPTRESPADTVAETGSLPTAANVATEKPENIREFKNQPPQVQQLLREALALTERNLTYKYGSSDPSGGGMDCSGFIYYVLTKSGFKDVPRDSSEQYAWIRQSSNFHAVLSRDSKSFEFRELRPGDLMFWSGTYKVNREIPVSHVMIYLGTEKSTKNPVMVGASDGRSYDGVRRNGVSVFDFKMPSGQPNSGDPDLIARFEGYGTIPGLREPVPANQARNFSESKAEQTAEPTPKKNEKPLSNGD